MEIKFDQHFLDDEKILDLIIKNSQISKNDIVFEIGSGDFRLSKKILEKKPKKLISCDIDNSFFENNLYIKNSPNFVFINKNGLDFFNDIKFNKIISNIPYSITEPLFSKILENKIPFSVLLISNHFYEKHIKNPKSKWFYFINSLYYVEEIIKVDGEKFYPQTKVLSSIIKLKIKDKLTNNEIFFINLFEKKERNIKNAIIFSLVDSFNISKKEAKILISNHFNSFLNKKLKSLSNEEFLAINKFIIYLTEFLKNKS